MNISYNQDTKTVDVLTYSDGVIVELNETDAVKMSLALHQAIADQADDKFGRLKRTNRSDEP